MADVTLKAQVMAQYNSRDTDGGVNDDNNDADYQDPREKYREVWEAIREFLGQHAAKAQFHRGPPRP